MKVSGIIEEVSRYLQDNEFEDDVAYVHWTKQDLLTYIRNAIAIVAMVRKEEFTSTVDVELVEGIIQELPAPCKSLRTVQGQKDENGVITKRVRETKISNLTGFNRAVCTSSTRSSSSEYIVKSYSYDEADPKVIIVDPPVPKGVSATLTITCYAPPEISGEDDELEVDDNFRPIIFELMLYYAYGVDIEDVANRERSNQHWKNALDLLQIYDYKQREEIRQLARRGVMNG